MQVLMVYEDDSDRHIKEKVPEAIIRLQSDFVSIIVYHGRLD